MEQIKSIEKSIMQGDQKVFAARLQKRNETRLNIGVEKVMRSPSISRSDRIPESMMMRWIHNRQLVKSTLSDLSFRSLFDSQTLIFGRSFHQNAKTKLTRIKMDKDEQRWVMKFFFLQKKKSKAISGELAKIVEKAAVSLITVTRCWRRFKQVKFPLDDKSRSRRALSDIAEAMSQFVNKEPFLSAHILARKLARSSDIIKEIRTHDLRMRKFMRDGRDMS
jgi:hypothetical protein